MNCHALIVRLLLSHFSYSPIVLISVGAKYSGIRFYNYAKIAYRMLRPYPIDLPCFCF